MKINFIKYAVYVLITLLIISSQNTFAWFDETHLSVARAAGYYKWHNAAAADAVRIKAGRIEHYNHFYNNPGSVEVTPEMVIAQAAKYNDPQDEYGHLYGAIIASLREYMRLRSSGAYAEYHLAFCAHYIADLSQPFHNVPYDDFNRSRHLVNDGVVNKVVSDNIDRIYQVMYLIDLDADNFEYSLAKEIARIANQARSLASILRKDERNMTQEEAYIQLGHSASLLKAVIAYVNKKIK